MEKHDLVYYPNQDFNGVLFILRKPHDDPGRNEKDTVNGNREWFNSVASNPANPLQQQYRNRFMEMLEVVHRTDLSHAALDNIKRTGGGATASENYWKISPEMKLDRIRAILDTVNPTYVFLPRDLYRLVAEQAVEESDGITYSGAATLKKCIYEGVLFYEIYHPSYRRKILKETTI